eukprot:282180-Prymnesium_polylepis.1
MRRFAPAGRESAEKNAASVLSTQFCPMSEGLCVRPVCHMSRATIDRFVAWHCGVRMIEWTGIEKNANTMARILPVFKAF